MRTPAFLTLSTLLVAGPTWAYTQEEIDQAAPVARQIEIVESIADDVYQGRDNDTPGSTAVQALLIQKLAEIADRLNSGETGDDAYRQAFSTTVNGNG